MAAADARGCFEPVRRPRVRGAPDRNPAAPLPPRAPPQPRTAPQASPYRRCPRPPRRPPAPARGCACSASRRGSGRRRSRGSSGRSCLHRGPSSPSSGTRAAGLAGGAHSWRSASPRQFQVGAGRLAGLGAVGPSAHVWEGLRHRPGRGGACAANPRWCTGLSPGLADVTAHGKAWRLEKGLGGGCSCPDTPSPPSSLSALGIELWALMHAGRPLGHRALRLPSCASSHALNPHIQPL